MTTYSNRFVSSEYISLKTANGVKPVHSWIFNSRAFQEYEIYG